MSNRESTVGTDQSRRSTPSESRFAWLFDPKLLSVALGSLVVVVISGLVQVSLGAYSMTITQAWQAVFNPEVVFNLRAWNAFLLGGELPEMSRESLIVWNIRLPRVFVAILVGIDRKSVV